MIHYIDGKLVTAQPTYVVLDVNGVGFEIFIPLSTFEKLPKCAERVKLYTHFQVRDDGFSLFGFYTQLEKKIFLLLISVSKIGPKIAQAILSGISITELQTAILTDNASRIALVPGIGKKTSERLIVELKEKFSQIETIATFNCDKPMEQALLHDAVQALVSLGYNRISAQKSVQSILSERSLDSLTIENVIKSALKQIK